MTMMLSIDDAKKIAGKSAAEFVQNGMLIGLGSGTTTAHFIQSLADRCKRGLSIKVVASSLNSLALAKENNIPIANVDKIEKIDLTIDGADEIDPHKQMIKGGGGALVREKILASTSKEMIVIIDETKLVQNLGKNHPLPVEIVPFAKEATFYKLKKLGYRGKWRKTTTGELFITDNHNYILDILFSSPPLDPRKEHESIIHIPGVVDTGFFFDLAGRVIIGYKDGQVVIKP